MPCPVVIVGVMPEHFEFPNIQKLWIPMQPIVSRDARNIRGLFTFARLAPGMTIDQADAEMDGIAARLASQYPDTNENYSGLVKPLREEFIPPDVTRVIWLMMAAATLVLFIACSNVANLQLARASARRREISVRTALGAQRGRIIRQLLTESVVLSLLSLPIGIILAQVGTRLIASAVPRDQVPYYITWEVDWRVLAFTVAVAVATAVLFGLFPALQASRGDLHGDLKEGTRGNSVRRSLLRSSLVVVQVALALVVADRRSAVRAHVCQPRLLRCRVRYEAAHDDAVLSAWRGIRGEGRESPARPGHRRARRGAAWHPRRVCLEPRAREWRRWRRQCDHRRQAERAGS